MAQEELNLDTQPKALSRAQAESQARILREEIRRHNHLYYVEARPEISDGEYDRLFRRLLELEEAFPETNTEHGANVVVRQR